MKYNKYRKEVLQVLKTKGFEFKYVEDADDVEIIEQCIRDYYDEGYAIRDAASNLYLDITVGA